MGTSLSVGPKKYEASKFVVWVTVKSTSVKSENLKLQANGDANLFDEKLVYRYLKLSCKHGGPKRIGCGRGERVFQETWKLDCPAKLHVTATRTQLVISELIEEHNHELSEENYFNLPSNRVLSNDAQEQAKLLFEEKVKPSVVRSLLRLRGLSGYVNARDLANWRAKWDKERHGGLDEKERLVDALQKIMSADPGTYVNIADDEEGNLKFLFLQTSAMKDNVAKYGRVLLMDHSHKVNRNRMPVCLIVVMDGNGNGRIAGYAFVANEQLATVKEVLTTFHTCIGEDLAIKVKTIIIDKDPSEIAAIQSVFPEARIQLCIFHVGRSLREKSTKESKEVKRIIEELKYAMSVECFDELCCELKNAASDKFYSYFHDNWEQCPQAWSYKDKQNSINLGNTTTNRVETLNAKVKIFLDSNSTLAEAVEGLYEVHVNKEEDILFRQQTAALKVAYMTTAMADPTINAVLKDLTKFAAKLLIWELQNIPNEDEIEYYQATSNNCSCVHRWSYELPCRHMFQCRRMQGDDPYKEDEIEAMWKKVPENQSIGGDSTGTPGIVKKRIVYGTKPKNPQEKFTAALQTGRELCSLLSECGTNQFTERHKLLKELMKMWAAGKEVVLLEKPNMNDNATSSQLQPDIYEDKDGPDSTEIGNGEGGNIRILPEDSHDGALLRDGDGPAVISIDLEDEGIEETYQVAKAVPGDSDAVDDLIQTSVSADCDVSNQHVISAVTSAISQVEGVSHVEDAQESGNDLSYLLEDDDDDDDNDGMLNDLIDALDKDVSQQTTQQIAESSSPTPQSAAQTSQQVSHASQCASQPTSLCRCTPKVPSTRFTAGPASRMAGRPYFACATRKCNFWQIAKQQNLDSSPNKELQAAFAGINLPICKLKGRPKGSNKAVMINFKRDRAGRSEKPKGAFLTPFEKASKGREIRGSQIKDKDVTKNYDGSWCVKSQTRGGVVYKVTPDSCSCFDWANNTDVCKHMFKIKSMISESPSEEESAVETMEMTDRDTSCSSCFKGKPSHACEICNKPVHAIEPCSVPGAEEGYGKARICQQCNTTTLFSRSKRRRRLSDESPSSESTDRAPSETRKKCLKEHITCSQISRSGRPIIKKKVFTPSKHDS